MCLGGKNCPCFIAVVRSDKFSAVSAPPPHTLQPTKNEESGPEFLVFLPSRHHLQDSYRSDKLLTQEFFKYFLGIIFKKSPNDNKDGLFLPLYVCSV